MRHILITSKHSYIGCQLEKWIRIREKEWEVDCLSVRNMDFENMDFSKYDAVVHVAALVHQREKPDMWDQYYKSNVVLTAKLAKKAKQDGVTCFLFMSSMSVYGMEEGHITIATEPNPKSFYGKTKWMAEQEVMKLADDKFQVAVVRPPMVYGEGCPGNYKRLSKLVEIIPVFPKVDNQRSMIYVGNLCELLGQIIKKRQQGLFMPQNKTYITTNELVAEIARVRGKKMFETVIGVRFINSFKHRVSLLQKVFGGLTYDKDISQYDGIAYQNVGLRESIELAETVGE